MRSSSLAWGLGLGLGLGEKLERIRSGFRLGLVAIDVRQARARLWFEGCTRGAVGEGLYV